LFAAGSDFQLQISDALLGFTAQMEHAPRTPSGTTQPCARMLARRVHTAWQGLVTKKW